MSSSCGGGSWLMLLLRQQQRSSSSLASSSPSSVLLHQRQHQCRRQYHPSFRHPQHRELLRQEQRQRQRQRHHFGTNTSVPRRIRKIESPFDNIGWRGIISSSSYSYSSSYSPSSASMPLFCNFTASEDGTDEEIDDDDVYSKFHLNQPYRQTLHRHQHQPSYRYRGFSKKNQSNHGYSTIHRSYFGTSSPSKKMSFHENNDNDNDDLIVYEDDSSDGNYSSSSSTSNDRNKKKRGKKKGGTTNRKKKDKANGVTGATGATNMKRKANGRLSSQQQEQYLQLYDRLHTRETVEHAFEKLIQKIEGKDLKWMHTLHRQLYDDMEADIQGLPTLALSKQEAKIQRAKTKKSKRRKTKKIDDDDDDDGGGGSGADDAEQVFVYDPLGDAKTFVRRKHKSIPPSAKDTFWKLLMNDQPKDQRQQQQALPSEQQIDDDDNNDDDNDPSILSSSSSMPTAVGEEEAPASPASSSATTHSVSVSERDVETLLRAREIAVHVPFFWSLRLKLKLQTQLHETHKRQHQQHQEHLQDNETEYHDGSGDDYDDEEDEDDLPKDKVTSKALLHEYWRNRSRQLIDYHYSTNRDDVDDDTDPAASAAGTTTTEQRMLLLQRHRMEAEEMARLLKVRLPKRQYKKLFQTLRTFITFQEQQQEEDYSNTDFYDYYDGDDNHEGEYFINGTDNGNGHDVISDDATASSDQVDDDKNGTDLFNSASDSELNFDSLDNYDESSYHSMDGVGMSEGNFETTERRKETKKKEKEKKKKSYSSNHPLLFSFLQSSIAQIHLHLVALDLANFFYVTLKFDNEKNIVSKHNRKTNEIHHMDDDDDKQEEKYGLLYNHHRTGPSSPPTIDHSFVFGQHKVQASRKAYKDSQQSFVESFLGIQSILLRRKMIEFSSSSSSAGQDINNPSTIATTNMVKQDGTNTAATSFDEQIALFTQPIWDPVERKDSSNSNNNNNNKNINPEEDPYLETFNLASEVPTLTVPTSTERVKPRRYCKFDALPIGSNWERRQQVLSTTTATVTEPLAYVEGGDEDELHEEQQGRINDRQDPTKSWLPQADIDGTPLEGTTFPSSVYPPYDRLVFIDNLPIDITDEQVHTAYSRCGKIDTIQIFHRRPELDPGIRRRTDISRQKIRNPSKARERWRRSRTPVYGMVLYDDAAGATKASVDALRIFGMVVDRHLIRSHRAIDMKTLYLEDIPTTIYPNIQSIENELKSLLRTDLYVCFDDGDTYHRRRRPNRRGNDNNNDTIMNPYYNSKDLRGPTFDCKIRFPNFEATYWSYLKLSKEMEFLKQTREASAEKHTDINGSESSTTAKSNSDSTAALHWMETSSDAMLYWTRKLNY